MFISEQETQPLPIISPPDVEDETSQQRYQRLKTFAEAVGIRFLHAYLLDEKIRLREQQWQPSHKGI